MGHVATLELPWDRRRELEPRDTWRLRSYPVLWGGSWRHRTCGSTWATPSQDSRSGATGHVVALELPWAKKRELVPQEVWRHLSARARWHNRCHGHVSVCECMSCPSSWLRACKRGYPVCRVPTITFLIQSIQLHQPRLPIRCPRIGTPIQGGHGSYNMWTWQACFPWQVQWRWEGAYNKWCRYDN
jgi:hypothetical protein